MCAGIQRDDLSVCVNKGGYDVMFASDNDETTQEVSNSIKQYIDKYVKVLYNIHRLWLENYWAIESFKNNDIQSPGINVRIPYKWALVQERRKTVEGWFTSDDLAQFFNTHQREA
eukprot:203432-Rhodomonas_salina.1